MKLTLLDMTQSILSSLDSDEVNSISDTTESLQVANIIKNTYFNIASRTHLPENTGLFQLDASTDDTIPVIMYKPSNVDKLIWIKYFDNSTTVTGTNYPSHDINTDIEPTVSQSTPDLNYKTLQILDITSFLTMVNQYDINEDEVEEYTLNGIKFRYKNNSNPTYCAVLSDYYILFDSYDQTVDDTVQNSKTQCYGELIPSFKMEDNFIPVLDDYQFPLLLNESKSLAFFELKQTAHQKAEQEAKRQWSSLQRDKSLVNRPTYFDSLPNFGRNSRKRWR